MEVIYTGEEKSLHYLLAKRIIKNRKINTDDIAIVDFNIIMPTDQMPLGVLRVTIKGTEGYIGEEKFYLKKCVKHNFSVTWANLKKGHFNIGQEIQP